MRRNANCGARLRRKTRRLESPPTRRVTKTTSRRFRRFGFYGVTRLLIVISSKSIKFFERHLPGRLFVPSPPIRHFSSFSSRDFLLEPSLSRDDFRSVLILSNPLIYAEFRTFQHLSFGCITRRKDIEKASCCDVMS